MTRPLTAYLWVLYHGVGVWAGMGFWVPILGAMLGVSLAGAPSRGAGMDPQSSPEVLGEGEYSQQARRIAQPSTSFSGVKIDTAGSQETKHDYGDAGSTDCLATVQIDTQTPKDPKTLGSRAQSEPKSQAKNALENTAKADYSSHPQYKRLVALIAHYRALQAGKAEPATIAPQTTNPKGLSIHQKTAAANRLALFGYWTESRQGVSGEALGKAIKEFQEANALACTGRLDRKTVELLNRPLSKAIGLLEQAAQEWKRLGGYDPVQHVVVNIPNFMVYGFSGSRLNFSSRVIVGKNHPAQRTPRLDTVMTGVETYPHWYVPSSQLGRLASAAGSNGFAWDKGRLVQRPGAKNALGVIKFRLGEGAGPILLHSTNKPRLFHQAKRSESLGCIRVQRYQDLVEFITQRALGQRTAIQDALAKKRSRLISLPQPVALYVMYGLAWVDELGRPHFFDDIYKYYPAPKTVIAQKQDNADEEDEEEEEEA